MESGGNFGARSPGDFWIPAEIFRSEIENECGSLSGSLDTQ